LAENIAEKFEILCEEFQIRNKVKHVVTDNASNMKKAFTIAFEKSQVDKDSDSNDENEDIDNEEHWSTYNDVTSAITENAIRSCKSKRLSCFAHSLQLSI
jgi:phosphate uptake regulator